MVLSVYCRGLDVDNFAEKVQPLLEQAELQVIDRQCDADLHTWRVEFEGTPLLLRGDHYTQTLWLEALCDEGVAVLQFLLTKQAMFTAVRDNS
ncbi:MAG: DUF3630 family protein [Plesiomonas sp.]|uniref:DUF3630 family protein n=1 Tax=Plesiomonas sp. TaxID=2486279 RepID=UPI003F3E1CA8